jgi:hypothetical protein
LISDQEFINALKEQGQIIVPSEHLQFISNKEFNLLPTLVSSVKINGQTFLFKKEEGNEEDCYFIRHGELSSIPLGTASVLACG